MTTEDFIKHFVKLSYDENTKTYGYNPFELVSIKDKQMSMHVLIGLNSQQCYELAAKQLLSGAESTFLAMDFSGADFDHITIFSFTREKISMTTIPYSTRTGQMLMPTEKHPTHLVKMKDFFKVFIVLKGNKLETE